MVTACLLVRMVFGLPDPTGATLFTRCRVSRVVPTTTLRLTPRVRSLRPCPAAVDHGVGGALGTAGRVTVAVTAEVALCCVDRLVFSRSPLRLAFSGLSWWRALRASENIAHPFLEKTKLSGTLTGAVQSRVMSCELGHELSHES